MASAVASLSLPLAMGVKSSKVCLCLRMRVCVCVSVCVSVSVCVLHRLKPGDTTGNGLVPVQFVKFQNVQSLCVSESSVTGVGIVCIELRNS